MFDVTADEIAQLNASVITMSAFTYDAESSVHPPEVAVSYKRNVRFGLEDALETARALREAERARKRAEKQRLWRESERLFS